MDYINLRARAKINLTLDVVRKRPDGYHDLKMVMQTVSLSDNIYIKKIEKPLVKLKTNIEWLPSDERNLAYKAAMLMKDMFSIDGGVFIELYKRIPVAAGLAGGSADCAAVLYGMNRMYGLNLTMKELAKIGVELGADVPYCLMRGTALAEGKGEILTRLRPCPEAYVVLARPAISLSTATVFKKYVCENTKTHPNTEKMIKAIGNGDIHIVAEELYNVLENVSVPMYPVIDAIKRKFVANGALGSIMSGSGPTVFAIFDDRDVAASAAAAVKKEIGVRDVIITEIYNGLKKGE